MGHRTGLDSVERRKRFYSSRELNHDHPVRSLVTKATALTLRKRSHPQAVSVGCFYLSHYNKYSTKMHFCSPIAMTMCSGLVRRAVRWDGRARSELGGTR